MTNLEAIRANISSAHGVVLTESHFVKALVDVGLNKDADYTSANKIDRATIRLYDIILGGAGISEGSLTYSFTESVKAAKETLEKKLGIEDKRNRIDSVKAW